jgi:hypothetical protein
MLGNQLNPSSTMAQKMSDTLSAELEAHSIFNDSSNSTTSLIGPQLHSRVIASVSTMMNKEHRIRSCLMLLVADGVYDCGMIQVRNASGASAHGSTAGTTNPINSNGGSSSANTSSVSNHSGNTNAAAMGSIPQSLDQLLERQWEQGSQFLMEQAQHFDSMSHYKTTLNLTRLPVCCVSTRGSSRLLCFGSARVLQCGSQPSSDFLAKMLGVDSPLFLHNTRFYFLLVHPFVVSISKRTVH